MGYWIHEEGIKAFFKRYMYVIAVIIVIASTVGVISNYSSYLAMVGKYNVSSFEECGTNLLECIKTRNETQSSLQECKSNLDRTLKLLEDLTPLQSQLKECRDEVYSLQEKLSNALLKINVLSSNATECDKSLLACQEALNVCNNTRQQLLSNLTVCEGNLTTLRENYDKLAYNAAYKICCFSDLKYYYIRNNTIVCVSEPSESLGTKELNC